MAKTGASQKLELTFKMERQTKGAILFHEQDAEGNDKIGDDANAVVGTLYLRKKQLGGVVPATLKVSIELDAK